MRKDDEKLTLSDPDNNLHARNKGKLAKSLSGSCAIGKVSVSSSRQGKVRQGSKKSSERHSILLKTLEICAKVLYSKGLKPDICEDIAQEAVYKTYIRFQNEEVPLSKFTSYARNVALYLAASRSKKRIHNKLPRKHNCREMQIRNKINGRFPARRIIYETMQPLNPFEYVLGSEAFRSDIQIDSFMSEEIIDSLKSCLKEKGNLTVTNENTEEESNFIKPLSVDKRQKPIKEAEEVDDFDEFLVLMSQLYERKTGEPFLD
jgi:hypothetical protein